MWIVPSAHFGESKRKFALEKTVATAMWKGTHEKKTPHAQIARHISTLEYAICVRTANTCLRTAYFIIRTCWDMLSIKMYFVQTICGVCMRNARACRMRPNSIYGERWRKSNSSYSIKLYGMRGHTIANESRLLTQISLNWMNLCNKHLNRALNEYWLCAVTLTLMLTVSATGKN